MNRKQKRAFRQRAQKRGISSSATEAYINIMNNGSGNNTDSQHIADGELVMLNIDAIKSRTNYDSMPEEYRKFVENNKDKVFKAHTKNGKIVTLQESPKWLYWCGDLIKTTVTGDNDDISR